MLHVKWKDIIWIKNLTIDKYVNLNTLTADNANRYSKYVAF
jgi:hypothetical protein